ncbi:unnamed protein product [Urochloa humidicola]
MVLNEDDQFGSTPRSYPLYMKPIQLLQELNQMNMLKSAHFMLRKMRTLTILLAEFNPISAKESPSITSCVYPQLMYNYSLPSHVSIILAMLLSNYYFLFSP